MSEEAQWREWPQGRSASSHAPTSELPSEIPAVSSEALVGQAVDCLRDWGVSDDTKTASADGVTRENIWRHHDAHPFVLLLLAVDRYGEDFVFWQPDTVKLTLERDGSAPSNSAFTKLMAARTLLATPSPWRQWEVFHWVSRALAGFPPNITYLEEPEIGQQMVCADLMKLSDPKRQMTLEVDKFVAAALLNEGERYAPAPLSFAQRELDQPQLRCTACEAIHRDDDDTKCVSCGRSALVKVPSEFASFRDQTKAMFEARKSLPVERALDGLPDTGVGNAVYRLLTHWSYARDIRTQMLQQLRVLGG